MRRRRPSRAFTGGPQRVLLAEPTATGGKEKHEYLQGGTKTSCFQPGSLHSLKNFSTYIPLFACGYISNRYCRLSVFVFSYLFSKEMARGQSGKHADVAQAPPQQEQRRLQLVVCRDHAPKWTYMYVSPRNTTGKCMS